MQATNLSRLNYNSELQPCLFPTAYYAHNSRMILLEHSSHWGTPSPEPSAGIHATAPCDLRNLDDWVPWPVSPSRNQGTAVGHGVSEHEPRPLLRAEHQRALSHPLDSAPAGPPQNLLLAPFLSFLKGHLSAQLPLANLSEIATHLPCTLPYFLPSITLFLGYMFQTQTF